MRSTKSNSSVPSATATSSSTSAAMRSISSCRDRIARGVRRRIPTRRSGPWRGGSSVTTISVGCAGAPVRPRIRPCSFEKRTGCAAMSVMSACLVIAQNGW